MKYGDLKDVKMSLCPKFNRQSQVKLLQLFFPENECRCTRWN